MPLNLDPHCRAAVDLAKKALPDGVALDAPLLLATLCHGTDLRDRFPVLAAYVETPRLGRRRECAESVADGPTWAGMAGSVCEPAACFDCQCTASTNVPVFPTRAP